MGTDSNQLHKPSDASMAAGYELSTVSVRGLIYFVIGLIIVAALVHAGIWFLLRTYEKVYHQYSRPGSAVVDKQTRLPLPPPPRLQPNPGSTNVPEADLQLMYSKEDELFTRMGWRINPQTHVPVEIPQSAIDQVIRDHPRQTSTGNSGEEASALSHSGAQH